MALVVDDHLLIDVLAEAAVGWIADEVNESAVYTTGSWYYRVANAAEHGSGSGSLSGRITRLPEADRRSIQAKLASLPDSIGLIGPRKIVPIMAGLRTLRRLNYLNADALALAVLTDATIAVRTDSPLLREACDALHVHYQVGDAP